MIDRSKLGAIAFMAAIGLAFPASPAFARDDDDHGSTYGVPRPTGRGSAGYINRFPTDYRVKQKPRAGYPHR
jgi:hypothetical protein